MCIVLIVLDGIPHASIWLNDTINGVKGTFIPLNNPAINSSSSERLYILTVFRPHKLPQNHSNHDLNMRLYAFDVTGNMAYRIRTVWYHDFVLSSATIPYFESQETVCTVSYPPSDSAVPGTRNNTEEKHEQVSANAIELPAYVLVQGSVILVALNYNENKSGDNHCLLLAVNNLGKNYSINFSKDTIQECHGMAYNSQDSTRSYQHMYDGSHSKQVMVWLHVINPADDGSTLLLMDMASGDVTMNVSLSSLLGKDHVKITTQMVIAYLYLGGDTDSIKHTSSQNLMSGKSPVPLIFGVTDRAGEGSVVAVDLSTDMKVMWTVPLVIGQYASGQICTVDRLKDSLMVFTDQSGVNFFKIS